MYHRSSTALGMGPWRCASRDVSCSHSIGKWYPFNQALKKKRRYRNLPKQNNNSLRKIKRYRQAHQPRQGESWKAQWISSRQPHLISFLSNCQNETLLAENDCPEAHKRRKYPDPGFAVEISGAVGGGRELYSQVQIEGGGIHESPLLGR